MSTLSSTRLRASGPITGLCRLRSWVEQQNAEYDRECRGADDGPYRLDADNVVGFEQRDGGFPNSLVCDLEDLFADLTFVGETWSDVGRVWNIEIRYGYTRVWCEDEHEWLARTVDFRDPGDPVDYGSIDPADDSDPEPPTGVAPTAQILPADFIDRMMRDETAPVVPKKLETRPGWPYEADPNLSGLDDAALIWELKRRGRAVISLGPNQVNSVYYRLTGRSPWNSTPLPPVVDGLLVDPLIAGRVQRRMYRSGIDEITTILEERLSDREPDLSGSVADDEHKGEETRAEMSATTLMADIKTTLARRAASNGGSR